MPNREHASTNQLAPARLLSVVLPAHNEQDNVSTIYFELRRVLQYSEFAVEIIFVDDGSTDATGERVEALAANDRLCRLIRLTRNFGHQAALAAGLNAARGAAVITMDCDLQHPPEVLPDMVSAWRAGALIVQMHRTRTADAGWFKRVSSAFYYRLMQFLCDRPLLLGPDFQLLDRQVVDTVLSFRSSRPFLRGIVAWVGFPAQQLEFAASARSAGTPSYSLRKMISLGLDGITTLSTRPLRLATYLGLASAGLCLCYSTFILFSYFMGFVIPGWTSVILTLLFLGGVQLLTIGRIYELARNVPPYLVLDDSSSPMIKKQPKHSAF
jgi:glycosyltransferase involved in cell wall biosynthesis